MKRTVKQTVAIFSLLIILFTGVTGYGVGKEVDYYHMVVDAMNRVYRFGDQSQPLANAYADMILAEHPEKLETLLDMAADQYDEHTDYIKNQDLGTFNQLIQGEYVGVGIIVKRISGGIEIESILYGGGAAKAGLMAGDRILSVNGRDIQGLTLQEITGQIKGKPGETVSITVSRGGDTLTFQVVRGAVAQSSVSYSLIDKNIGYMAISSFADGTPREIENADFYFRNQRIKKLIIDLRDNPGGELMSVIQALGYFIPQGKPLVSIEYGNTARNTTLKSVGDIKKKGYYSDIVVLINEKTASAAELFAGNIRCHLGGTLIGVTSYGKGTVQELLSLPPLENKEFGAVKITVAEYILPDGYHVDKQGLEPDISEVNRIKDADTSGFEPMNLLIDYEVGKETPGILAIKQRLDYLGYFVGEKNDVYHQDFFVAIREFQETSGLETTGVADFKTLLTLRDALDELEVEYDDQFDLAVNILQGKIKR